MEPDALQAPDAKRRKSVIVLQASELTLNSGAASRQLVEPLAVAPDLGEQPPAKRERENWLPCLRTSERNNRVAAAFLALA